MIINKDGSLYIGEISLRDNIPYKNGKGVYLFNKNEIYIGSFINDLMDGQGQLSLIKKWHLKEAFLGSQFRTGISYIHEIS